MKYENSGGCYNKKIEILRMVSTQVNTKYVCIYIHYLIYLKLFEFSEQNPVPIQPKVNEK